MTEIPDEEKYPDRYVMGTWMKGNPITSIEPPLEEKYFDPWEDVFDEPSDEDEGVHDHLNGYEPEYVIVDELHYWGVLEKANAVAKEALSPHLNDALSKEQFPSGAQRDTSEGKSRPDFINPKFLLRIGEHLRKGGEHYGPFNFDKGIPSQRYMESLQRHILQYYSGDRSEDHLSAAVFNLMGIAMNEGTALDDLHEW